VCAERIEREHFVPSPRNDHGFAICVPEQHPTVVDHGDGHAHGEVGTVEFSGRVIHDPASTSRFSPSICTDRERTGRLAGPRRTAPEVTSNWLPWHAHVTKVPSSLPFASEHPV